MYKDFFSLARLFFHQMRYFYSLESYLHSKIKMKRIFLQAVLITNWTILRGWNKNYPKILNAAIILIIIIINVLKGPFFLGLNFWVPWRVGVTAIRGQKGHETCMIWHRFFPLYLLSKENAVFGWLSFQ